MNQIEFEIRGEHITLDALLKATGLAHSGGAAKQMVHAGQVQVNGQSETRRACKLRPGMVVAVPGHRVRLTAAPTGAAAGQEALAHAGQPEPSADSA